MHVGEDVRDVQRMDQIRLARAADLPAVLARRKDVRTLEQFFIEIRLVALDLVEDVFEADHGRGQDNRGQGAEDSWRGNVGRSQLAVDSRTYARLLLPTVNGPRSTASDPLSPANSPPLVRLLLIRSDESAVRVGAPLIKEVVVKKLLFVVFLLVAIAAVP